MKQSIHLRLGQHLTMTPQLQQAIRLLQLSSVELQTEIQEALESNPLLESEDENNETNTVEGADNNAANKENDRDIVPNQGADSPTEIKSANENEQETRTELSQTEIPDDLAVDSTWDDIYDNVTIAGPRNTERNDREVEIPAGGDQDLQEYLLWQIGMARLSEIDEMIATSIIDAINSDGYLDSNIEDIHQAINKETEITPEEVEAVLRLVQSLDPIGVGARDLGECLSLQLEQCDPETPFLSEAKQLVREHINLLGNHDYTQLIRRMKLSEEDLQQTVMLIRAMNPRPGGQISSIKPEYITPDVYVRKVKGQWKVELNPESAPRLRVNPYYANMIRRADNSNDNNYLKNNLQEARWFLKSLQSRNETLLKVATSIVKRQEGFLEEGEEAMKALVLHDIAEEVEMHESTISRVTTRKYMHTPRGIYELKYFFSSHVSTSTGGECSSTAIRAYIKKLVAAEDLKKPLSDNKIAELLDNRGIKVARRTVAKYREAMSLPPSNERKRLM